MYDRANSTATRAALCFPAFIVVLYCDLYTRQCFSSVRCDETPRLHTAAEMAAHNHHTNYGLVPVPVSDYDRAANSHPHPWHSASLAVAENLENLDLWPL